MRTGFIAAMLAAAVGMGGNALAQQGQVDDARLLAAGDQDDANWITFGQDYRNQRFSSLDQINRDTIGRLVPVWIYQTGIPGSTQTHPLVVDGVMYFSTPGCDVIAVNAATGDEIWRYRHRFANQIPRASSNRGVAVAYGRVYLATDDTRVIALDQATGEIVWDRTIAPYDASALVEPGRTDPGPLGFVLRAAPLAYGGHIVVGATGFEANDIGADYVRDMVAAGKDVAWEWLQANLGRRAFLFSLDAATGEEVWRWYGTPEEGWEGVYAETAPDGTPLNRDIAAERAAADRYGKAWAAGSTPTWMTPAFDPTTGTIFIGTGNPAPGSVDLARPGDNLYANGIVALDMATGALRWFFQEHPHGTYDATGQAMLVDAEIDGMRVPAVAECGKTGWCYMIDRSDGHLLFQSEAVVRHSNIFAAPTPEGVLVAPGGAGGVGVSPTSYDPDTGYLYVAAIDRPQKLTLTEIPPADGGPTLGYVQAESVPLAEAWGTLTALDMKNGGRIAWQVRTPQPLVGGTVATAGGLVFTGEANGHFDAFDAATGAALWTFQTGANVGAPPMTYAVAGRQFVAVATGAAMPAPGTPIAAGSPRPGGAIMVFALPQP